MIYPATTLFTESYKVAEKVITSSALIVNAGEEICTLTADEPWRNTVDSSSNVVDVSVGGIMLNIIDTIMNIGINFVLKLIT